MIRFTLFMIGGVLCLIALFAVPYLGFLVLGLIGWWLLLASLAS